MPKGFSLVEALIAMCVFSIAMLAPLSMYLLSFRQIKTSYFYNIALFAADSAVAALYADTKQLFLPIWEKEVHNKLPQGEGVIIKAKNSYVVKVKWNNPKNHKEKEIKLSVYK